MGKTYGRGQPQCVQISLGSMRIVPRSVSNKLWLGSQGIQESNWSWLNPHNPHYLSCVSVQRQCWMYPRLHLQKDCRLDWRLARHPVVASFEVVTQNVDGSFQDERRQVVALQD